MFIQLRIYSCCFQSDFLACYKIKVFTAAFTDMCCVQPVQGKGFGVIAQKDFKTGESILTEEVLLYCTRQEGRLGNGISQYQKILN